MTETNFKTTVKAEIQKMRNEIGDLWILWIVQFGFENSAICKAVIRGGGTAIHRIYNFQLHSGFIAVAQARDHERGRVC